MPDNTRSHVAQSVVDLFIDYTRETLCHPPYSPSLSPSDFDRFSKLEEPLCETHFGSLDEFSTSATRTPQETKEKHTEQMMRFIELKSDFHS